MTSPETMRLLHEHEARLASERKVDSFSSALTFGSWRCIDCGTTSRLLTGPQSAALCWPCVADRYEKEFGRRVGA